MNNFKKKTDFTIFVTAVGLMVAILAWSVFNYDSFAQFSGVFIEAVKDKFGGFINIVTTLSLLVSLYFLISKHGDYVIGGKDAKADVSFFKYFTMALCGVIGVGIIFWGIAEPLTHFMNPPANLVPEGGGTPQAAVASMGFCFTHWGLQLYGVYTVVGILMAIAFYSYKLPTRISTIFYPMIGDRIYGKAGKIIDGFCVCTYICATSTTFAFASLQLTAGTTYFTGMEASKAISVGIIIFITVLYTISACTGIKKGVAFCSQINFYVYIFLLVFTFIMVKPQFVTELFNDGLSYYVSNRILAGGLETDAFRTAGGWYQNWPVFYFVWGIATALVNSVFLAKISKGRTLRQFVIVNLVLPTCFAYVWFGIFGGSAIYLDFFKDAGIGAAMLEKGTEFAAFEFFSNIPMSKLLVPVFFIAVVLSFSTCANSCVTAMSSMTQKLEVEQSGTLVEPPMPLKITYGLLLGGISIAVLFLGGAKEVQAAAVAVGLPTAVMILIGIVSLFRFLSPSFMAKHQPKDTMQ